MSFYTFDDEYETSLTRRLHQFDNIKLSEVIVDNNIINLLVIWFSLTKIPEKQKVVIFL